METGAIKSQQDLDVFDISEMVLNSVNNKKDNLLKGVQFPPGIQRDMQKVVDDINSGIITI